MRGGSGVTLKNASYSPYRAKIGIKAPQVPIGPPKDEWYINDMGKIMGPVPWNSILIMAEKAQVTPYAQIRNADWQQWAPIWHYVRIKTAGQLEAEALIPSRYDAIFFLGVILFLIGLFGLVANPYIGIPLLFASPIIEIEAVYWESKHKARAAMRTFGNAIAVFWIVLQILISFFFMITVF